MARIHTSYWFGLLFWDKLHLLENMKTWPFDQNYNFTIRKLRLLTLLSDVERDHTLTCPDKVSAITTSSKQTHNFTAIVLKQCVKSNGIAWGGNKTQNVSKLVVELQGNTVHVMIEQSKRTQLFLVAFTTYCLWSAVYRQFSGWPSNSNAEQVVVGSLDWTPVARCESTANWRPDVSAEKHSDSAVETHLHSFYMRHHKLISTHLAKTLGLAGCSNHVAAIASSLASLWHSLAEKERTDYYAENLEEHPDPRWYFRNQPESLGCCHRQPLRNLQTVLFKHNPQLPTNLRTTFGWQ